MQIMSVIRLSVGRWLDRTESRDGHLPAVSARRRLSTSSLIVAVGAADAKNVGDKITDVKQRSTKA